MFQVLVDIIKTSEFNDVSVLKDLLNLAKFIPGVIVPDLEKIINLCLEVQYDHYPLPVFININHELFSLLQ